MRAYELYEGIVDNSRLGEIHSVFDRVWNSKYPRVTVYKDFDPNTDIFSELKFYTDEKMQNTYGGTNEFELAMSVDFNTSITIDGDNGLYLVKVRTPKAESILKVVKY